MNKEYLDYIENFMQKKLNSFKNDTNKLLFEGIEYCLCGGGKRIRPYLMLLTADFLGVEFSKVEDMLFSLECIHTYSLIHDDLPSMDNDDFRRGRPTAHKVFGEGIAILLGDSLLNLAYENLFKLILKDENFAKSASLIAEAAGKNGMIEGQVIDITKTDYTEEEILYMYKQKTGKLIYAAVMAPYFVSNKDVIEADLIEYANCIGLIFQLTDDILDYYDGNDKDKLTYVNLFGKEKTVNKINYSYARCNEILIKYEKRADKLSELTEFIVNRKK